MLQAKEEGRGDTCQGRGRAGDARGSSWGTEEKWVFCLAFGAFLGGGFGFYFKKSIKKIKGLV